MTPRVELSSQIARNSEMKILVIGGGGREHALCWKLSQSARRPKLFCAPGNAGTAAIAENVPIATEDLDGLLAFARKQKVDLTFVGPEEPLCAGIVDRFTDAGLRIFGPTAAAAQIEGDKAYAKRLMRECGVPTAEARVFEPTEQEIARRRLPEAVRDLDLPAGYQRGYDQAMDYVATRDYGLVVKAAGLAKGKGVFVHPDPKDAKATLEDLMLKRSMGVAGERVVIEELLTGPEVSVMALVDGRNIYILESAADHKRLGEQDTGPNTGGMGAYSPSDALTEDVLTVVERDVFVPIVDGMAREGVTYRGVLYAGMMLTAGGPKVLEFNARLGDPETQPLMMRLKSDMVDVIEACIDGRLDQIDLAWERDCAVCVVMASGGYPNAYETGLTITGLEQAGRVDGVQVFHAGTKAAADGRVVTAGGRVLGVTALGDTIHRAAARAYEAAKFIHFDGAYLRGDIGLRVSGR